MQPSPAPVTFWSWGSHWPFLKSPGCSLNAPPFPERGGTQLPSPLGVLCCLLDLCSKKNIKWALGNDVFLRLRIVPQGLKEDGANHDSIMFEEALANWPWCFPPFLHLWECLDTRPSRHILVILEEATGGHRIRTSEWHLCPKGLVAPACALIFGEELWA